MSSDPAEICMLREEVRSLNLELKTLKEQKEKLENSFKLLNDDISEIDELPECDFCGEPCANKHEYYCRECQGIDSPNSEGNNVELKIFLFVLLIMVPLSYFFVYCNLHR